MNPTSYPIGTEYRVPGDHWAAGYHTGVDFLTPVGSPIVAPQRSRIEHAGRDGGWGAAYGLHVIGTFVLDDGLVYRWICAHLSKVTVAAGESVETGDLIGLSGQSGNTTGPHLHFEARRPPYTYGSDVPPALVTQFRPTVATPVLDRQIDELGAAIAASKPGRVRRLRRQARQALLQARAIIKGRA